MCNIAKALARAFTPPGTGGFEAQQEAAVQDAQQAANVAIKDANAASLPVLDNPSAIAANQDQVRKLLAQNGAAWSFGGTPTIAPPVATRQLLGA